MMTNILYIVSHPIQYQAPLLRLISQSSDMKITALFYWDKKSQAHFDEGFGREVVWDVPILSGYHYYYLNELAKSTSRFQKIKALWKIIRKKDFDVVWTHGYADLYTMITILFARIKKLKVFVRGESLNFPDEKQSSSKNSKRKWMFALLRRFVDGYLAIGTNNKTFYLNNGVAVEKIFLANYAVDNDFFYQQYLESKNKITELKETLNLDPSRLVILYASKFITRKYPIDVLNAYLILCKNKKIPKPYLLFIGMGETLDDVKKAAESEQDNVHFLGFKNQSELPDYYALSDILVLPSMHENWGLIVNEAMNAECAIIVSDHVGCAPDLVQQNMNGYVYPVRDVEKLALYLEKLAVNRDLCDQMKIKSREIISHWGLSETVDGLRKACISLKSTIRDQ